MHTKSKRIVFCTFGSLGDIFPYLALAGELRRRGHSPAIATLPVYRDLIDSHGIAFHPVRPDIDISDPGVLRRALHQRSGGKYIVCDLLLPAIRNSYEDTARAAAGADLIVTHPVTLAAYLYARKTRIPWVSTALAPVSLYSCTDPPVLAGVPFANTLAVLGPSAQWRLLKALAFFFEPQWKPFRHFERALGLSPAPNPLFWGHSPHLVLALFSRVLAPPQSDWPANTHATGFPFLDEPAELPHAVERFLATGAPPVVFTLGSAAVGAAGAFYEQSIEAISRLGVRAILLTGRNQPGRALPPQMLAVDYLPHRATFPRASVIVHQGGIGTTGEALRAGRPMLAVPFCHDQPDQAARLMRLGVARSVPRERYSASRAAAEIRILLRDPVYAARAQEAAARVRGESGVAAACNLLCSSIGADCHIETGAARSPRSN